MKIFLSSTSSDLTEHRRHVIEAIDGLRTNGADVDWMGMEAFGARDDTPLDACITAVDECDLYLGMFGVRYGSKPPGSDISFTEAEYRHVVKRKMPRLIFLIDEDNAQVKPKDFERDADGQKKLKALNEELKKERVVDFFTTPEDLAVKVATALAEKVPSVPRSSLVPFPPLPYFVHPYPIQANFTGRAKERADLSDWLTRGERKTESVFVVEAIGGMGKSSLAWYWLHNDVMPHGNDYWSIGGLLWWSFYDAEGRDLSKFLERAIEYASGGTIKAKDIPSDRERVEVLTNLLREKRFLFVLDGFERVLRAFARLDAAYRGDAVEEDARGDYRACADPNIGIFLRSLASGGALTKTLITSRLYPRELDDLDGARKYELTGMDLHDAVGFFHKQKIQGNRAEIEAVCAEYGIHPLTLRLLSGTLAKDPRYHADIRYAPRVNPLAHDKEQKILDFAYNSLPPPEQKFISQLAAFRRSQTPDDPTGRRFPSGGTPFGRRRQNKSKDARVVWFRQ